MTSPAETVREDVPVADVGRTLREQAIGSVVVTDDETVTGILTKTDIVDLALAAVDIESTPVREAMTADPTTVSADALLQEAADLFGNAGLERLPVVAEDDLVGVLTTTDVAAYLPRLSHRVAADGGIAVAKPGANETVYDRVDWEFTDDGDLPDAVEMGETFRFEKTLTDADVAAFAEASGDTNRLHLDDDFAAETRFGGRIAHGTLVAGVISAALARLPGTVIYLSQNLGFQAPVPLGETVSAEVTALERYDDDRWRFETAVYDSSDTLVIDGEATVMLYS